MTNSTKQNLTKKNPKKIPKKKILFILTYFYAGGTERVILSLSEKLIKKNCDITILSLQTFDNSYEIPKQIKKETLNSEKSIFHHLRKFFIFHAFIKIINSIKLLRHFKKMETKLDEFDLILNQETVVLPTFALKKSTKNKIFSWIHNDRHIKLKTKLKRWMYKKRLDGTKIITVSQGVKNFLKQCNVKADMIKIIYNPFDIKINIVLSTETNTQIPNEPY